MVLESSGNVRLEDERCLNKLYRGIECRTCIDQCPSKALSWEGNRLVFNQKTCVGCGHCVTHCPTGVFRMEKWDEKTLVEAALQSEADTIVLFCSGHQTPYRKSKTGAYDCFQVPMCLTGVSKAALFEIAAKKRLELMVDACAECEHGSCLKHIKNQAARTCEMLTACRGEGNLYLVETRPEGERGRKCKAVPSGERACSRRELLFRLVDNGLKTVSAVYERSSSPSDRQAEKNRRLTPVINGVRLGRRLNYRSEWSERLMQTYRNAYLEAEEQPEQKNTGASPSIETAKAHGQPASWPSVRIRSNCTNCNLCASFCPTGALRIEVEEAEKPLEYQEPAPGKPSSGENAVPTMIASHYFQPMLCIDCRLCSAVCPIEAIVRDRAENERPFKTRIICQGEVVPCKKCGALTYHTTTAICHWCQKNNGIEDIKQAVRIKLSNHKK